MSKKTSLSEENCEDLIRLLDSGFSFRESLDILDSGGKNPVMESMKKHLNSGEEASSFLSRCLPRAYVFYYECFSAFLPFLESMKIARGIVTMQKKAKTEMEKGLFYPLFLLAAMTAGVFVFDRTVLPSMMSMMESFHIDGSREALLQKGCEAGLRIFIGLAAAAALSGIYFFAPKRIVKTYQWLAVHMPDCLTVQYASLEFARIFRECEKVKLSTRESIAVMKKIETRPLVSFIAGEMEKSFLAGTTMSDAVESPYLEKKLARFFRMAVYAGSTEEMLSGYLAMSQARTARHIRTLTRIIQAAAYGGIGILLVLVYQVLMMPMTMLKKIG